MKEIECPSCGEYIPDDSKYCDMCGTELLACVSCGAIGAGNFCGQCGGAMVSRKNAVPSTTGQPVIKNTHDKPEIDDGHGTGKGNIPRLRLRDGNLTLIPRDGAIIGRKEGEYAMMLKDLNLISRRHGQFIKKGRTWHLVDFGSTNGCFINDIELDPNVPIAFKKGDVVDIGTYLFDVI